LQKLELHYSGVWLFIIFRACLSNAFGAKKDVLGLLGSQTGPNGVAQTCT